MNIEQTTSLVSIVINNYNYDCFLQEAIESALDQTYRFTEVIVVDDGSTDNSRKVIMSYSEYIIGIFQENGKQASALNRGYAMSRGDIIIFLDSDDYLYPYAVERIVSVWQANTAKVHYRLNVVDTNRQLLGYSLPQGDKPLSAGEVWRSLVTMGGYRGVPMSGNAISRKVLDHVFPIPNEHMLTADDYLSVIIPFYGIVNAIDIPLGAYRLHDRNQWALHTVDGDRFHRFLRQFLVKRRVLQQKISELGYELPLDIDLRAFSHWWTRMASFRLDPIGHPIPADNSFLIMTRGVIALWRYSDFKLTKRLIYTLWLIWVGLMPASLATVAIIWLFVPPQRPKFFNSLSSRN